ncbi:MAG: hypothetical protein DMD43_01645 [Gemmatimonadetes bacterium]|nr:MAG: hypothetical protein DMD43_01645 [Gemmatimonadota bacterium]
MANPHSFLPRDSAVAVRIGAGMRERIERVAARWFRTIPRARMNEALVEFGFPADAVMPAPMALQLGRSLQARTLVLSSLLKEADGRYTVEARLAGVNDDAGHLVRLSRTAGETPEEFGGRLGGALAAAFRALPDARLCESLRSTAPEKALVAGLNALRSDPSSGLAHYCIAKVAEVRKAPRDSVIAQLRLAVQGDALSLPGWSALAVEYQEQADTAATVETFKQMLRVAPTNESLRAETFRLLLRYGRPEAAEEVADEGLQLDSANADLWELKSSACLFQNRPEKNRCAVEALERVYALDSVRVDSSFFTRLTFAASRPVRVDTVRIPAGPGAAQGARDSLVPVVDGERFLKWSRIAVSRYPANAILFGQLVEAFSVAGPMDSAIVAVRRLLGLDSSDVRPVVRVAKALRDAKRGRDVLELTPYVERLGSPVDRENMAAILSTGGFGFVQPPPDYALAAEMGRTALRLAPPEGPSARLANLVRGLAVFQQMVSLDDQAVKSKSCPIARQMRAFLDEAGPALEAGRTLNERLVARYLDGVRGFGPHITSLVRAYCR